MSAGRRASGRRGHRRRRGGAEHDNEDRWLLTYADMITLLMALFMILFAMSSIDSAKYESLQHALQDAFSGRVLPGGNAVRETGSTQQTRPAPEAVPIAAIKPIQQQLDAIRKKAAAKSEADDFARLKRQIDAYAREHGLTSSIETFIARRGLVVRLLTDRVLFATGSADLEAGAAPLLARISGLLRSDFDHPILIEGHTDAVPIRATRFPTNWELSTSRASTVVRFLMGHGVPAKRLAATGYASQHPIATNRTVAGRARNRRVEIVLARLRPGSTQETTP
jgi:chemotaxis protein MotB